MQYTESKKNQPSPCSVKKMPLPEMVLCTGCGEPIEIWSDETEASCDRCGRIHIRTIKEV